MKKKYRGSRNCVKELGWIGLKNWFFLGIGELNIDHDFKNWKIFIYRGEWTPLCHEVPYSRFEFSTNSCYIIINFGWKSSVFYTKLLSTKNHIKIRFRSCFTDINMIGVFESKFLLVTIICSVPILNVLTVKIIITRRSLGYKLNTNSRTRTCNYSEF